MITICLGGLGSGKTASVVRDLALNPSHRTTYSNIITMKLKNVKTIDPSMIISRKIVDHKKKRSGELEPVYKDTLNLEFWKKTAKKEKGINVVLDEAHSIINSRRSTSKINIIVTDWIALLRRVLGQTEAGYGELILISQLPNRLDIISREMATKIKYHVCHYIKSCKACSFSWRENSEMPEPAWTCLNCGTPHIKKHSHVIEVYHFNSMDSYLVHKQFGSQTYHKHYFIKDIEDYFNFYDTLQWDNLFSEYYN